MTNDFDRPRGGSGTREWSEHSLNIGLGCSHGCLYCYARTNALRWKKIEDPEDWTRERLIDSAVAKSYGKRKGVIMFPTTHDITPFYLSPAVEVLKKVLRAGNQVLVVSKPHFVCTARLCDELTPWKDQVMFRFTITSDGTLMRQWEPGAPSEAERLEALSCAFIDGYRTSVSAEPLLTDCSLRFDEAAKYIYLKVRSHVTHSIWFGLMNHPAKRTSWCWEKKPFVEVLAKALDLGSWKPPVIDRMIAGFERLCSLDSRIRLKENLRKLVERKKK